MTFTKQEAQKLSDAFVIQASDGFKPSNEMKQLVDLDQI